MKHHCPICRKPTDSAGDADFPFCSERCRLLDLGKWASERYVVSEPLFEEDAIEAPGGQSEHNESSARGSTGAGQHERKH